MNDLEKTRHNIKAWEDKSKNAIENNDIDKAVFTNLLAHNLKENRYNELKDLIAEIKAKEENRGLSDEYLKEHNMSTREEIGIGEYAYGIIMIPEEFVLPYLEELGKLWRDDLNESL